MSQYIVCLQCHTSIAENRKFCSRRCANSYNNKLSPKRQPQGSCSVCATPIRTIRVYCSQQCRTIGFERKKTLRIRKSSSESVVSWRQRTKLRAVGYKGGKCKGCGYDKCIQALTFHHLDPTKKDFGISAKTASWDKLVKELDKCVLLCSNCHAEVHAGARRLAVRVGLEPTTGVSSS